MVALRCASLAVLLVFALASDCDQDELDLCDYMATDCDADELDLCDHTADDGMGGGGSIDDSASPATDCDADELDLCDYKHATPAPTQPPAATPEPSMDAADDSSCMMALAGLETDGKMTQLTSLGDKPAELFAAVCEAGAFQTAYAAFVKDCAGNTDATTQSVRSSLEPMLVMCDTSSCEYSAMQIGKECKVAMDKSDGESDADFAAKLATACDAGHACNTAIEGAKTNCAATTNPAYAGMVKQVTTMCHPCMQKMLGIESTCKPTEAEMTADPLNAESNKMCGDSCNTLVSDMETLKCDKMSDDGRRLSAGQMKMIRRAKAHMMTTSGRRMEGHGDKEDDKEEDPGVMMAKMIKYKKFMCGKCGMAAMPVMQSCGMDNMDKEDDKDDRRLDSEHDDKEDMTKMCSKTCQDGAALVMSECKTDRRLEGHGDDDKDDMDMMDMDATKAMIMALKMTDMCSPCAKAMMGVADCTGALQITTAACKEPLCVVQKECPAVDGLTKAPGGIKLEEYTTIKTVIDGLDCTTPAPTPADPTAMVTIQYAVEGDYEAVVGSKKAQFLDECTASLSASSAVCSDVRAGSIIVDITGKTAAANSAVQAIESSADKTWKLPSFDAVKTVGVKATVAATTEAIAKYTEAFPTPAPTAAPLETEDADGACSIYGTLAGTSMVIAVANIV